MVGGASQSTAGISTWKLIKETLRVCVVCIQTHRKACLNKLSKMIIKAVKGEGR